MIEHIAKNYLSIDSQPVISFVGQQDNGRQAHTYVQAKIQGTYEDDEHFDVKMESASTVSSGMIQNGFKQFAKPPGRKPTYEEGICHMAVFQNYVRLIHAFLINLIHFFIHR